MENLKKAVTYLSELIEKVIEETIPRSDFADLTQHQLYYLKVIVKMKDPTLTELANELGLTKPTVTVLADNLTKKGYVRKESSVKDRRRIHLHIDKKGARIIALRKTAHEKITEKIKANLSEAEIVLL